MNKITREKYNTMCPLAERKIVIKDHAPWFNAEILRAKKEKRGKKNYGVDIKMKKRGKHIK